MLNQALLKKVNERRRAVRARENAYIGHCLKVWFGEDAGGSALGMLGLVEEHGLTLVYQQSTGRLLHIDAPDHLIELPPLRKPLVDDFAETNYDYLIE